MMAFPHLHGSTLTLTILILLLSLLDSERIGVLSLPSLKGGLLANHRFTNGQRVQSQDGPKRITYFQDGEDFTTLNASLFTHVNLAFADIQPSLVITPDTDTTYRWTSFAFHVSTSSGGNTLPLLSIQSSRFPLMAATYVTRWRFIRSCIKQARACGFLGIDLDWELPNSVSKRFLFSLLLRDMRRAFTAEGRRNRKNGPLLLTAAVAAWRPDVKESYNVPVLYKYLDWVNIMTYDLAGSWNGFTGEHTALQNPNDTDTSIAGAMQAWRTLGMGEDKMVMGLACYGRSFNLNNAVDHGIGAPATGAASFGDTLTYNKIVNAFIPGGATTVFDTPTSSMYAYNGKDWIGYDNPATIAIKVKYFKDQGMAGYMVWSYNGDDAALSLQKEALLSWP